MKITRIPVKEAEPKKIITIYQWHYKYMDDVTVGPVSHDFFPESEMVPVYRETVPGNKSDDDILNGCFERFNFEEAHRLIHSLSVGDIVSINDTKYRCMFNGWKRL